MLSLFFYFDSYREEKIGVVGMQQIKISDMPPKTGCDTPVTEMGVQKTGSRKRLLKKNRSPAKFLFN